MAVYVLALVDSALQPWSARGRRLRTLKLAAGVYAVCETRRSVPEPSDAELRTQHAAVVDLASRVEAVLPARFGTLLSREELQHTVNAHLQEIAVALDEVRGRVQMTLRVTGERAARPADPAPRSGREYLAERRRAASAALPATAAELLRALRPVVIRERVEAGAGALLATVYHLVSRSDAIRYRGIVGHAAPPNVIVSGPWPPFAFTPRLL